MGAARGSASGARVAHHFVVPVSHSVAGGTLKTGQPGKKRPFAQPPAVTDSENSANTD
jgi:hypothetical protein